MPKRKYGYILLTLLVISGLAGTPSGNTLTNKERKYAAEFMKATRMALVKSVKDLSFDQVNFTSAPDQLSIKECIYRLAYLEKRLWNLVETAMKAPANPEKRSQVKYTDDLLVNLIGEKNIDLKYIELLVPEKIPYRSMDEAVSDFKATRASHIKYVKSTTEDLRSHVAEMSFGWLDCYQLCLMITANSNRTLQQINDIKKYPGFP